MAEYWKSTPRYWCKHCSVYVRDTKLERQNHDATAKHQGAVKRALRDLHRGHEREERDKDRARREIERLNGVVSGAAAASSSSSSSLSPSTQSAASNAARSRFAPASVQPPSALTETERKRQAEQLASLGVNLPDEFRRDLAMAGDWQVTTTTVVQESPDDARADTKPGAAARGIHKRDRTEEQVEEDEAVKSLFKKPRRWGRDSRTIAGQDDGHDLDALLSGGLTVKKKEEGGENVKKEQGVGPSVEAEEEEQQQPPSELPPIKKEEEEEPLDEAESSSGAPGKISVAAAPGDGVPGPTGPGIKTEDDGDGGPEPAGEGGAPAPVVFKKRKPKNIRQK